jgi:hypothetical protein
MNYLLAGLAVYKLMQFLNTLTPKEAMPWVKVLVGVVLGYGVSFIINLPDKWTSGLVVATIASASHGLLRLLTLHGDLAARKTYK